MSLTSSIIHTIHWGVGLSKISKDPLHDRPPAEKVIDVKKTPEVSATRHCFVASKSSLVSCTSSLSSKVKTGISKLMEEIVLNEVQTNNSRIFLCKDLRTKTLLSERTKVLEDLVLLRKHSAIPNFLRRKEELAQWLWWSLFISSIFSLYLPTPCAAVNQEIGRIWKTSALQDSCRKHWSCEYNILCSSTQASFQKITRLYIFKCSQVRCRRTNPDQKCPTKPVLHFAASRLFSPLPVQWKLIFVLP